MSRTAPCPPESEVLADLVERDLLELQTGERLWKLYCFRPASGRATDLRHRIYTKVKADGRLALVTFAAHTSISGRSARSRIARVADLPPAALEQVIQAICHETRATPEEYDALDLSGLPTLEEQLEHLKSSG